MIASTSSFTQPNEQLQAQFLELVPRLQTYASSYFGYLRCPHKKADKIQEALALAWKWYLRLNETGKDVAQFPASFVFMVVRAVKCGRRLAGMERAKDAMSPLAQQRYSFRVERLPVSTSCPYEMRYGEVDGQDHLDAMEERLHDNLITPVPEQAAFRIDWPRFLGTLTQRDRKLALFLSLGHSGKRAAQKFRLTPGRITQLRQRWHREWHQFQDADTSSTEEACLA